MTNHCYKRMAGGTLTALALVFAGPSYAEDAVPASSDKLEEIVVTAQKRSENIKDVPISIAAVSATALQNAGVTSVEEVPTLVSGLRVGVGAGTATVFMRGVGNESETLGNEASVAVFIDGVYYAHLPAGALELNNIDHIEVLKGPQGTLFGRNADAELIHVITKDPGSTLTFHMDAGYGNYGTFMGNLYASIPISDKLSADIAAHATQQSGSYGHYYTGGAPFGYFNDDAFRSKWVYRPTDDTKITLTVDYFHDSTTVGIGGHAVGDFSSGNPILNAPYTVPVAANPKVGFYDAINGPNTYDNVKDQSFGTSVHVEHDFSFATLSSISAYHKSTGVFNSGADYSPVGALMFIAPYWTQQFTQEVQLASQRGSSFDWTVGVYYMNLSSDYVNTQEQGPFVYSLIGAPLNLNIVGDSTVNSYAAYTQETFHITPQDNITTGLRYTLDRDSISGDETLYNTAFGLLIPTPYVSNKVNFEKITYRLAYDHHFNDNAMAFVSYSRGFKSGTFNLLPPTFQPAAPEELDAVEVGGKLSFLDQRLHVNPSFFYDHVKNPQVQESINTNVFLVNAQAAETYGLDLDGEAVLTNRLRAHISGELLHAVYTSYQNAPIFFPALPYGLTSASGFNAAGQKLPNAPTLSYDIGFSYRMPSPAGDVNVSVDYAYNSGYRWDPDNFASQGPFGLLSARATYVLPTDDRWSFSVWGKNLTGSEYYTESQEFAGTAGHNGIVGVPRTFGFSLAYDM